MLMVGLFWCGIEGVFGASINLPQQAVLSAL